MREPRNDAELPPLGPELESAFASLREHRAPDSLRERLLAPAGPARTRRPIWSAAAWRVAAGLIGFLSWSALDLAFRPEVRRDVPPSPTPLFPDWEAHASLDSSWQEVPERRLLRQLAGGREEAASAAPPSSRGADR